MAPKRWGANWLATKIEVGPSAAPIIPIEAASRMSKPANTATTTTKKIPNWAAAPKSNMKGFWSNGPKSIIAPIPMKISRGKSSVSIPARKRMSKTPCWVTLPTVWSRTPEPGKLTRIVPKPIGTSKVGSYSFLIPRYMSRPPMTIMKTWPMLMVVIPWINVSTVCLLYWLY